MLFYFKRMLVYDNTKRASSSTIVKEIDKKNNQIETPILTISDFRFTINSDQSISSFIKNEKHSNESLNRFKFLKQKK